MTNSAVWRPPCRCSCFACSHTLMSLLSWAGRPACRTAAAPACPVDPACKRPCHRSSPCCTTSPCCMNCAILHDLFLLHAPPFTAQPSLLLATCSASPGSSIRLICAVLCRFRMLCSASSWPSGRRTSSGEVPQFRAAAPLQRLILGLTAACRGAVCSTAHAGPPPHSLLLAEGAGLTSGQQPAQLHCAKSTSSVAALSSYELHAVCTEFTLALHV